MRSEWNACSNSLTSLYPITSVYRFRLVNHMPMLMCRFCYTRHFRSLSFDPFPSEQKRNTHTHFIHRIIWISDIELMASIQTFPIWKWMDEVRHSTASHQAVKINATTWPQWISSRDVKCEWNAVYFAVVLLYVEKPCEYPFNTMIKLRFGNIHLKSPADRY